MNELKNIEDMSFEEALHELEQIVRRIDTGGETLELAVKSFERAILLKKCCESRIEDAKMKIEQITKLDDKNIKIEEIKL